jgi:hypothetical protein
VCLPDTDAGHVADALLAARQVGLLLAQAQHTTTAPEAGLDNVIDAITRHSTADTAAVDKRAEEADEHHSHHHGHCLSDIVSHRGSGWSTVR